MNVGNKPAYDESLEARWKQFIKGHEADATRMEKAAFMAGAVSIMCGLESLANEHAPEEKWQAFVLSVKSDVAEFVRQMSSR